MTESTQPRRRDFISGAGALCAGVMANVSTSAAVAAKLASAPGITTGASALNATRFRACLGQPFEVQALGRDAPAVSMTLADVTSLSFGTASKGAPDLSFSIDLAGITGSLQQDTYAVSHPRMGEFIALLVPSADGRTLTGVFHRYA